MKTLEAEPLSTAAHGLSCRATCWVLHDRGLIFAAVWSAQVCRMPAARGARAQVVADVRALGALAGHMRRRRFAGGALRLDNVKLNFRLGADGNPAAAEPHVQREANQLVEELMLKANMAVAALLADAWPAAALLRRHPPPLERKMAELGALSEKLARAAAPPAPRARARGATPAESAHDFFAFLCHVAVSARGARLQRAGAAVRAAAQRCASSDPSSMKEGRL